MQVGTAYLVCARALGLVVSNVYQRFDAPCVALRVHPTGLPVYVSSGIIPFVCCRLRWLAVESAVPLARLPDIAFSTACGKDEF